MREAIIHRDTSVTIHEAPVPSPGPSEVLIRVVVFGTNPKDWKGPFYFGDQNSGDDVAGVVEAVGSDVFHFKRGDRVAGFHVMESQGGAFAEFSVVPSHTAFHIPPQISFEEAATIPLAALTSAFALFHALELPTPWQQKDSDNQRTPLIIYGASSSIGAFAIKLASVSQIHPIIAIGSSSSEFIKEYLDPIKGDVLLDYTDYNSANSLASGIREALDKSGAPGGRCFHAFDAVSKPGTFDSVLSKVLAGPLKDNTEQRPRIAVVVPEQDYSTADKIVDVILTRVGMAHSGGFAGRMFGSVWCSLFSEGLHLGWLKPHPHEVITNGLNGLEEVLKKLKAGEIRAKKMVGRIEDTR